MERMTHKAQLQYWVEALHRCARECAERGISKQQWIAGQGVSAKTFYNWQRRIREAASEQMESKAAVPASESPVLAELPVAKSVSKAEGTPEASAFKPAAILRVGRMEAALSDAVLPELMRWLKEADDAQ